MCLPISGSRRWVILYRRWQLLYIVDGDHKSRGMKKSPRRHNVTTGGRSRQSEREKGRNSPHSSGVWKNHKFCFEQFQHSTNTKKMNNNKNKKSGEVPAMARAVHFYFAYGALKFSLKRRGYSLWLGDLINSNCRVTYNPYSYFIFHHRGKVERLLEQSWQLDVSTMTTLPIRARTRLGFKQL